MKAEPQKEHEWLQKMVGVWNYVVEASMAPGQPVEKVPGTDSVRSVGGLWVLCEGRSQMPDGSPATTYMTLGYDPQKKRFVGTFIGSMMSNLWIYDGELEPSGRALALLAEGPSMSGDGSMAIYRDVIEFKNDNHRVLSSFAQGPEGEWKQFMTANYHRVERRSNP